MYFLSNIQGSYLSTIILPGEEDLSGLGPGSCWAATARSRAASLCSALSSAIPLLRRCDASSCTKPLLSRRTSSKLSRCRALVLCDTSLHK